MFTLLLFFALRADAGSSLEVVQRAQLQAGTALTSDATLAQAARCLVTRAKTGQKLDASLIRFCTDNAEVYDGALVPLIAEAGPSTDMLTSLVPYFKGEAKPRRLTHYGAASITDGSKRIIAVISTQRRGTLQAQIDCKTKRLRFSGSVEVGHTRIRAFLTDTSGAVGPVNLALEKSRSLATTPQGVFSGDAPIYTAGKYQLEVLADAKDGPHVVANRAIYACVQKPSQPELPASPHHGDPATRLLKLMNDARKNAGQPPLIANEVVAKVAKAHASDMRAKGYFAHNGANGGTLSDRLKAAGIAYNRAAENLSAAPLADDAHASLMSSPGHRKNILDPELSQVGIGVVENPLSNGEPNLIFVIDFITPPKSSSPSAFAEEVLTVLNQLRAQRNEAPLKSDAPLKQLAMDHAQAMANAEVLAYQPSDKVFFADIRALTNGKESDTDLFVTNDADVVRKSQNADKIASKVAIGVAQKSTKRFGEGMFFVTVIYVR